MDSWDRIDDRVDKAVLESGQKKSHVIYSAWESDDNDDPIDNLDEVAIKGKVILVGEKNDFFGGESSRSYVSELLENPTWLQVCVCANAMIRRTRDLHHVFLEGVSEKHGYKSRELEEKVSKALMLLRKRKMKVKVYEFDMGS